MNAKVVLGMKKQKSGIVKGSEIIVDILSVKEKEYRKVESKGFTGSMYSDPESSRV